MHNLRILLQQHISTEEGAQFQERVLNVSNTKERGCVIEPSLDGLLDFSLKSQNV